MTERVYGWVPDVSDHRDLYFSATSSFGVRLPDHVEIMGRDNPIENQGSLGSCTGNAVTSAFEIVLDVNPKSRLFVYYNARLIENSVDIDAGAMLRDCIKGLIKYGVCNEYTWEYDISKFAVKPSDSCYEEALDMTTIIERYERVTTLKDIKIALSNGLPVIFGFAVPDYFDSEDYSNGHVLRLPTDRDAIVGGHAVVAVGYDDRESVPIIHVRNSWGTRWGDDGYFKMDQKWFTDKRRLCDDMWVIHPITKTDGV